MLWDVENKTKKKLIKNLDIEHVDRERTERLVEVTVTAGFVRSGLW